MKSAPAPAECQSLNACTNGTPPCEPPASAANFCATRGGSKTLIAMLTRFFYDVRALFAPPSAEVLALRELEDAKRKLLEAQTGREYADSMCKYHEARIKRLTVYLHNSTEVK